MTSIFVIHYCSLRLEHLDLNLNINEGAMHCFETIFHNSILSSCSVDRHRFWCRSKSGSEFPCWCRYRSGSESASKQCRSLCGSKCLYKCWKIRIFLLLVTALPLDNVLSYLISVKCVMFSIFWQHIEIFGKKVYSTVWTFICLESIPIRIWQNDADPIRSRSGSTTLLPRLMNYRIQIFLNFIFKSEDRPKFRSLEFLERVPRYLLTKKCQNSYSSP